MSKLNTTIVIDVLLFITDIVGLLAAWLSGNGNAMSWLILMHVHLLMIKVDQYAKQNNMPS